MCKLTNLTLLLNNAYNLIFIEFLIILQIKYLIFNINKIL